MHPERLASSRYLRVLFFAGDESELDERLKAVMSKSAPSTLAFQQQMNPDAACILAYQ
jgi:hypothetical protein